MGTKLTSTLLSLVEGMAYGQRSGVQGTKVLEARSSTWEAPGGNAVPRLPFRLLHEVQLL
jgi:hypothetical protein